MEKAHIYITRKIPEVMLQPFQSAFSFRMWEKEDEPVPREILLEEVRNADAVMCVLSEKIDEEFFLAAPKVKIVANMAVGYDNMDIQAAKRHNVILTNTPDVLTETTADLGFSLLMAVARRIVEANQFIKKNQWKNWSPLLLAGTDIHHKTIGIVGMGRIGEAIARRAKGFNMDIVYHNRSRNKEAEERLQAIWLPFEQLIQEADFVVSVIPLTDETYHLFDELAFKKMKDSAIFINISRGAVVDEGALVNALESNQIRAAGLDVFEKEPIASNHPLMNLENVVCLPHIGSATKETREKMMALCLENIDSVLRNQGPKTPI
ncbi:D-glycerate dehydrogenase [Oceanobacillus piezotolerans]|uniref:D-glycerate dehydrogenase n=1 Tax=Oceanobacillus piezotolerans TaxID=2448030 RepID=A0A498D7J6_9BACI|nr:D-glycerate dehydrogenase [Oceanobacillus piezotolerans]RLL46496.1 D-glycerate dehydrogenase [Oceanobacillus piezotolerans]